MRANSLKQRCLALQYPITGVVLQVLVIEEALSRTENVEVVMTSASVGQEERRRFNNHAVVNTNYEIKWLLAVFLFFW